MLRHVSCPLWRRPASALLLLSLTLVPVAARAGAPTVAIADLDNHTGDPGLDGAGAGVAAVLISKFARVDVVRVVERTRLQELLGEMELARGGVVDPATAAEAGKLVGADYLVLGSIFSVQMPAVAITLRVVEVGSGEVVAAEEVTGSIGDGGEEFFVLVDDLGFRILDALQLRLAGAERIEFGQVEVRQLDTVTTYGAALQALDRGASGEAEDLLTRAVALEPGFRLAEAELDRLATMIRTRRTTAIDEAMADSLQRRAALRAAVDGAGGELQPTVESLARAALLARMLLYEGEFEASLALQLRRAEVTEAHIEELRAAHRFPDQAFFSAWHDVAEASGFGIGGMRELAFWPHEIRSQRADLLARLGRREEGLALAIENYQHPGPVERPGEGAEHPLNLASRHGMHDARVTMLQQALRQRELAGVEDRTRQAMDRLDQALEELRQEREDRAAYQAVLERLERGTVDTALLRDELGCIQLLADQSDLTMRAIKGSAGGSSRGSTSRSAAPASSGIWPRPTSGSGMDCGARRGGSTGGCRCC